MVEALFEILRSGWATLVDYLLRHTLTCLVPSLFIAGAISTFVSKESVLKYFGPNTNKFLSYAVASVSGTILAVCSCTVLPLFAGIFNLGAGLGPAITFLYSGPAINIMAIAYSARLLGLEIGLARALGAVLFSVLIGLSMAFLFKREEEKRTVNSSARSTFIFNETRTTDNHRLIFLFLLVSVLLTATLRTSGYFKWPLLFLELVLILLALKFWFEKEEVRFWLEETWKLTYQIFPLLLLGVFLAGVFKALIPSNFVTSLVGKNTILANIFASISGALMYFATLTEVPIIKAFMELGMNKGPALSLLLSGPAVSLPSILVLIRIMGAKKTASYIGLVVLASSLAGFIFGSF